MNIYDEKRTNICVIGDETAQGYGDELHLGFLGRVLKREAKDINAIVYNLGIFGATSVEIERSLEAELSLRFDDENTNRLIVMMPSRDISAISVSRSRLNLANILDKPTFTNMKALVLGPVPLDLGSNAEIAELSSALSDVCARRNVQYIDLYSQLESNQQWIQNMLATDAKYPNQIGYGLIAWIVLHSDFAKFLED